MAFGFRDEVKELPTETITEEDLTAHPGGVHSTCMVCMGEFTEGEEGVRKMPCAGGHRFHTHCIRGWLIQHDTCPNCMEHLMVAGRLDDVD